MEAVENEKKTPRGREARFWVLVQGLLTRTGTRSGCASWPVRPIGLADRPEPTVGAISRPNQIIGLGRIKVQYQVKNI